MMMFSLSTGGLVVIILLLGLLLGWLIGWLVDWLFWQRNREVLPDSALRQVLSQTITRLRDSEANVNTLTQKLKQYQQDHMQWKQAQTQVSSLKQKYTTGQQQVVNLNTSLNQLQLKFATEQAKIEGLQSRLHQSQTAVALLKQEKEEECQKVVTATTHIHQLQVELTHQKGLVEKWRGQSQMAEVELGKLRATLEESNQNREVLVQAQSNMQVLQAKLQQNGHHESESNGHSTHLQNLMLQVGQLTEQAQTWQTQVKDHEHELNDLRVQLQEARNEKQTLLAQVQNEIVRIEPKLQNGQQHFTMLRRENQKLQASLDRAKTHYQQMLQRQASLVATSEHYRTLFGQAKTKIAVLEKEIEQERAQVVQVRNEMHQLGLKFATESAQQQITNEQLHQAQTKIALLEQEIAEKEAKAEAHARSVELYSQQQNAQIQQVNGDNVKTILFEITELTQQVQNWQDRFEESEKEISHLQRDLYEAQQRVVLLIPYEKECEQLKQELFVKQEQLHDIQHEVEQLQLALAEANQSAQIEQVLIAKQEQLAKTEASLLKTEQQISELKLEIKELKQEANKAAHYKILIDQIEEELQHLQNQVAQSKKILEEKDETLQLSEGRIAILQETLTETRQAYDQLQEEKIQLETQMESVSHKDILIMQLEEQITEYKQKVEQTNQYKITIDQLEKELQKLHTQSETTQIDAQIHRQQLASAEQKIRKLNRTLSNTRKELSDIRTVFHKTQNALRKAEAKLTDLQGKMDPYHTLDYETLQNKILNLNEKLIRVENERAKMEKQLARRDRDLKRLRRTCASYEKEATNTGTLLARLRLELSQHKGNTHSQWLVASQENIQLLIGDFKTYHNQLTLNSAEIDTLHVRILSRIQELHEWQSQLEQTETTIDQLSIVVNRGRRDQCCLTSLTALDEQVQAHYQELEILENDIETWQTQVTNSHTIFTQWQERFTAANAEMGQLDTKLSSHIEEMTHWYEKVKQTKEEADSLQHSLQVYERESTLIIESRTQFQQILSELCHYQKRLASQETTLASLYHTLQGEDGMEQDDLRAIHGIGSIYANRLNEAGISSFADLAELTEEKVEQIIQPKNWHVIEPYAWIKQAQQFSTTGGVA